MSTNFFSSLSGNFDYVSSMSGLLSDYSSIKNGSYGSLMKSYVNKVGNKNALNAYRETGSTTTAVDSATSTSTSKKSSSSSKSSFLDSRLNSIKDSGTYPKKTTETKESDASSTTTATTASTDTKTTESSKYDKLKSSWLDDQLKQYDKDANKTTAADTSVSYNTTV